MFKKSPALRFSKSNESRAKKTALVMKFYLKSETGILAMAF